MRSKIPLIVESHPVEYTGYPFITLVQYNKQNYLTIVDDVTDTEMNVYVLDLCGPETIDQNMILTIAERWYDEKRNEYPLSVLFSRLNITPIVSKILRTFSIDYVTRVIGPVPQFIYKKTTIRRRKRKNLPVNIEIVVKSH